MPPANASPTAGGSPDGESNVPVRFHAITTLFPDPFGLNVTSICDSLAAAADSRVGGRTVLIRVVTDPVGEFPARQSGDSARTRK